MCDLYLSFVDTDSEENSNVPPPDRDLQERRLFLKVAVLCSVVCMQWHKNQEDWDLNL